MPKWFEPDYDYVYLLVNHPAFWSDVHKCRFLCDANDVLLTRMQKELENFIKSSIPWGDGGKYLPYYGFTTQKYGNIFGPIYHAVYNHEYLKRQPNQILLEPL